MKHKDDLRDKEIKKLQNKLVALESYRLKLRDREEEIQILNNHINDITHSHSFAVEKLQSVTKELEKERMSSKRISRPINMSHFAP